METCFARFLLGTGVPVLGFPRVRTLLLSQHTTILASCHMYIPQSEGPPPPILSDSAYSEEIPLHMVTRVRFARLHCA
jgi:hypothetical protein